MTAFAALRWADAFVFSLALCMAAFFLRYVAVSGFALRKQRVVAALGLSIYFAGHVVYLFASRGRSPTDDATLVFLAGGLAMALGAVVIVRVFTTAACGWWTWRVALAAALLMSALLMAA